MITGTWRTTSGSRGTGTWPLAERTWLISGLWRIGDWMRPPVRSDPFPGSVP